MVSQSVGQGFGAAGDMTPLPGLLAKAATGIIGFDELTGGGLPRGRPTLVVGQAGCGKTIFGMEFLVRGIVEFGEPGVFVAFEETAADLATNFAAMGFDLDGLEASGRLVVDHIDIDRSGTQEAGEWDLDGLLVRLGASIDEIGAKRVVLDTIETLFGVFTDVATLRAELRRLFVWLKARGVTAVVTGEQAEGMISRHGIEEYVSDCVVQLDHRVEAQSSTRRLRVVKYRGSAHGTNEYPFLISSNGFSVTPITSVGLLHGVSATRVSTGTPALDRMLGNGGFYRGSTVLVSGTAGTGKSTIAAQFCDAACRRGERAIYVAFEESEAQIVRNMASVDIHLGQWIESGLLRFRSFRPSLVGLEGHLHAIRQDVDDFDPAVVIKDPISDLLSIGTPADVSAMLSRQVDFLKGRGVTTMFTSLDSKPEPADSALQIDSLIDTWIVLKTTEHQAEQERELYILKSRGMAHTNLIRSFALSDSGISIDDGSGVASIDGVGAAVPA